MTAQLMAEPAQAGDTRVETSASPDATPGTVRVRVFAPDGLRVGSELNIEPSSDSAPLFISRRPTLEPEDAFREAHRHSLWSGFVPVPFEGVLPGVPSS